MSFFSKPVWAQPGPSNTEDDDSDGDLFSHKSSFLSIAREQSERQKKEKERQEQKKAKKGEKRRSSKKRKSEEPVIKNELKQRRITGEEKDKLLAHAGIGKKIIDLSDDDDDEPVEEQLPVRRSPRGKRVKDALSSPRPKTRSTAPIDIGNESEDDIQITAVKAPSRPARPEPEEPLDSDSDIAEMQRAARAKARAKPQQTPKASSPDGLDTSDPGPSTPAAPDPVVKILVTSTIRGTSPLILCRKVSQRLREVREVWCKKQGFSEDFSSTVFLVHRGRQYWDSTTVRRLGLEVDASGRVYMIDDPSKEDVDQVHVEVVTPELFEEMKAERAREAKAASGVPEEEKEEEADGGASEEPPAPQNIRLTVKAKGKTDWKVMVTPTTLIAKIMKAAKKNLGFAVDQNVYLEFDGERLEPNQTVGDTEIEDMYCLDMYVES